MNRKVYTKEQMPQVKFTLEYDAESMIDIPSVLLTLISRVEDLEQEVRELKDKQRSDKPSGNK